MRTNKNNFINFIWAFFALVLIFSGIFLLPVLFSSAHPYEFPNIIFLMLAASGPAISGILLTYITKKKEGLLELWKKIIGVKRVGVKWYVFIFVFIPITVGFAIFLDFVISGNLPELETLNELLLQPITFVIFILFNVLFGPLPEEIGWRGYGLDRCQEKWDALIGSLILGTFWAFWHLPLFFLEGTYQYELGAWSLYFWLFYIDIITFSVVITWVYNNNERSTLSAILLHFMANFTGQLLNPRGLMLVYRSIIFIIIAIIIVYLWGPKTLTREIEK